MGFDPQSNADQFIDQISELAHGLVFVYRGLQGFQENMDLRAVKARQDYRDLGDQ